MNNKVVCVTCQVEFRVKTVGVELVELIGDPPRPYRIWSADLSECPSCGYQIINRFADQPHAQHFQDSFNAVLESIKREQHRGRIKVVECYEHGPVRIT